MPLLGAPQGIRSPAMAKGKTNGVEQLNQNNIIKVLHCSKNNELHISRSKYYPNFEISI